MRRGGDVIMGTSTDNLCANGIQRGFPHPAYLQGRVEPAAVRAPAPADLQFHENGCSSDNMPGNVEIALTIIDKPDYLTYNLNGWSPQGARSQAVPHEHAGRCVISISNISNTGLLWARLQ